MTKRAKGGGGDSQNANAIIQEYENLINSSRTEQGTYDFKAGLVTFGKNQINTQTLEKVIKTLTAMNNVKKWHKGYVFIGIAESEEAAERHKESYGSRYKMMHNSAYVVGIESEAKALQLSVDRYTHNIKELINNSASISSQYKMHLLKKMKTFNLENHDVIMLETNFDEIIMYNKKLYIRKFTDVEEVAPQDIPIVSKQFYENTHN